MTNKSLRIAYFGTPSFSTFVLDALDSAGYTPTLIVTVPDRPAGRGLQMMASPVKEWALTHDVATIQPQSLQTMDDELSAMVNSEWDLFIIAAYGKILPQHILDIPAHGALNVHPSLLPKFRGSSPIESQILQDEKEVGVSVMVMDAKMDHGPILAQARIAFTRSSSEAPGEGGWPLKRTELEEILWSEGGALLAESIPGYLDGTLKPEEQNHAKATLTSKLSKEDGLLDLSADGYQNYLKFCAYYGWPGTYFFQDKKRIKINDAVLENGQFKPTRVTPEGKNEQDYKA